MKSLLVVLVIFVTATAAWAEIYTWKDTTGTRFYTNSLHEIPARYLKKARVLDVATGKLGGLATAQPAAPAAAPRSAGTASAAQPLVVQAPPGQPGAAPELPQRAQAAAPPAASAPAAAAVSPATPVVERAAAAPNSTRPAGRLSRRELRALGRRTHTAEE
ncbi:hypothetical protein [Geomonas agri]|uniref:hypothetical protein n=1 Tax=Geomonas agri TaxID=2873702 RepID=UPI001CD40CB7|nr:hypothetical protein [Geomonas agri]